VLGRTVEVRVTSLSPQTFHAVNVVEVSLDDASDARVLLAADLEPAMDYDYAIEFHSRSDTTLAFDTDEQALVATGGGGDPVYVYSDQPLASWSGNNLSFDAYLDADVLDETLYGGGSDGRAALSVAAQPQQRFYPYYGLDFRYDEPGSGTERATFTPNFPRAGQYEVFVWWGTTPTGASNAPYTIHHQNGSTLIRVNIQGPGSSEGTWYSLGTFDFAAGTTGRVVLSDDADGYVGADAVRFVEQFGIETTM
jgi:hypothetical protein